MTLQLESNFVWSILKPRQIFSVSFDQACDIILWFQDIVWTGLFHINSVLIYHTAWEIPYNPEKFHTSTGCLAPMFAESVYRVNTINKLKQCGSRKSLKRDY